MPSTSFDARQQRLVDMLERASASSRFSFSERWLFGAGGALAAAGFVFVVVGWVGASRTVLVAGQIPYLLSGGLIGLGCIFLGGFLYFGRWMAVGVRESRERAVDEREELASVREGIEDLNRTLTAILAVMLPAQATDAVHTAEAARAAGPAGSARPDGAAPARFVVGGSDSGDADSSAGDRALVATANGSMMHRRDCAAVSGKANLRPVSGSAGLKPCGMCRPLDATAGA